MGRTKEETIGVIQEEYSIFEKRSKPQ